MDAYGEKKGSPLSGILLGEALTLLALALSLVLFRLAGIGFDFILLDSIAAVFMLSFFALPAVVARFALGFYPRAARYGRRAFTAYFLALLAFFLLMPSLGFAPTPEATARVSLRFGHLTVITLLVYASLALHSFFRDRDRCLHELRRHARELTVILRVVLLMAAGAMVASNLKTALPLFRIYSWDPFFLKLDTLIALGSTPYQVLHRLFPVESWTAYFHQAYFFIFYFHAFGLGGALVFGSPRYLLRVADALVTATIIGTALYWAVPSLGPCFYSKTTASFAGMADEHHLKSYLLKGFMDAVRSPSDFEVMFGGGIAAFPSLHVTFSAVLLYYLHRKQRFLAVLLLFPLLLLMVSTVYLGWHYLVDLPGGLLLAWAVIVMVERSEGPGDGRTAAAEG